MAEMFKEKEDAGEKIAFSKNQKGIAKFESAVKSMKGRVVSALKGCFPKKR
ncbi:MAG: hypothetical protein WC506_01455 [Candidatus Micrarchaeia archaeon]